MVCRMNLSHTVGDIRSFINAYVHCFRLLLLLINHVLRSDPINLTRPYTIGTAFPNKTLDNDTQTIRDAGLANSVVLQKWV